MDTPATLQQELLQHDAFVQRLARFLVRDANDAEDLAQDVWLRALETKAHSTSQPGLRNWLASAARGMSRNRHRSARRRTHHEQLAAHPERADCPIEAWTSRQAVVQAVLALEEPFRTTVLLAYGNGLSPVAIAAQMDLPEGTVRSRLHRAHAKLREQLEDRGGDRKTMLGLAGLVPATEPPVPVLLGQYGTWLAAACAASLAAVVAWQTSHQAQVTLPDPVSPLSRTLNPTELPSGAGFQAGIGLATENPNANQRNPVALTPEPEHPFWLALRSERNKLQAYTLPDLPLDRSLRKRVRGTNIGIPQLINKDSFADLVHQLRTFGIPLIVSPNAQPSQLVATWLAPVEMTAEAALDLLCTLSGQHIGWDIRDGSVHIETEQEQLDHSQEFVFGVTDLLLSPGDYSDGTAANQPTALLFDQAFGIRDLATLISTRFSQDARAPRVQVEPGTGAHPGHRYSLTVRHTPRSLLAIQTYLDQLRGFLMPLPEDGQPGQTLHIHRHPEDAALIARIRSEGGFENFRDLNPAQLKARLADVARTLQTGVLWGTSAQTEDGKSHHFEVVAGNLWVLPSHELLSPVSRSELLIDMRPCLESLRNLENLPAAAENEADVRPTPFNLDVYLRTHIAPESWNSDPQHAFAINDAGYMRATHSPLVLEEIQALVEILAGE